MPKVQQISPGDWRLRGAWLGALVSLLVPLALPLLAHRLWIRRKGLIGLSNKLTGYPGGKPPTGRVLVHGVSLGEVALMRCLVPDIDRSCGAPCMLTTTTETGWSELGKRFPDHPKAFLPFDLPWAANRFLSETKPKAVVLLELELWPQLLIGCHRRGIPVYLVNARLSDRSFRGYRTAKPLLSPLLGKLRLALGQNATWAARLHHLGAPQVAVTGSLKADMVALADAEAITSARQRFALDAETPTLLIASTSAPEEGPLIEAWQQALPGWRLVLCPRHPERGSHLADLLGERGLSCWRSSIETEPPSKEAVILVDEIGQLAALYAIASIACVGGSFGSGRHGQNMFEPAAVGTPTIVGMDTSNFPDVMAQLRAHQGIIESETSNIAAVLADLAADQNKRQELGENGQRAWQASRGSARRTLRHLLPELTGSQSR